MNIEKAVIIRIIREYNLFDSFNHIKFLECNFNSNFFYNSLRWSRTKEGYNFWFSKQLKLVSILCNYEKKNKRMKENFSSYLNFMIPIGDDEFYKIIEKYKDLYKKL